MASVSLRNIRTSPKTIAGFIQGFESLSIEIPDRDYFVLTGPCPSENAAVLRIISGLAPTIGGEIFIAGRSVTRLAPKDREIALVSRKPALYSNFTVSKILAFSLQRQHQPSAQTKRLVAETAELIGIGELLPKKPHQLSKREAFLVELARALVRRPKVCLLDDPLADFCREERASLYRQLLELWNRVQVTFVHSTSCSTAVMTLASRVGFLQNGLIQQCDTPEELYGRPINLQVARSFGPTAMNLVRGIISRDKSDKINFQEIAGTIVVPLSPNEQPWTDRYLNSEAILGFRDDKVAIEESSTPKPAGLYPGVVEFAESMGPQCLYTINTGGHQIVSRMPGSAVRSNVGRRAFVKLDLTATHFYDPTTGSRLGE